MWQSGFQARPGFPQDKGSQPRDLLQPQGPQPLLQGELPWGCHPGGISCQPWSICEMGTWGQKGGGYCQNCSGYRLLHWVDFLVVVGILSIWMRSSRVVDSLIYPILTLNMFPKVAINFPPQLVFQLKVNPMKKCVRIYNIITNDINSSSFAPTSTSWQWCHCLELASSLQSLDLSKSRLVGNPDKNCCHGWALKLGSRIGARASVAESLMYPRSGWRFNCIFAPMNVPPKVLLNVSLNSWPKSTIKGALSLQFIQVLFSKLSSAVVSVVHRVVHSAAQKCNWITTLITRIPPELTTTVSTGWAPPWRPSLRLQPCWQLFAWLGKP